MKIEGSIRANLISAISSAQRWRGQKVHRETLEYWKQVLDHGRRISTNPLGEPVGDLVVRLETELTHARAR